MQIDDTYYLSSLDSSRFAPVRECMLVGRLLFDTGKPAAMMKIDPPVIGQDFNLGTDIDTVLLANRHEGETLFPIKEFPCFVYICRFLIEVPYNDQIISNKDVEIVGWGELYKSRKDAENHSFD